MPALLMRMSMAPNRSSVAATAAWRISGTVRSPVAPPAACPPDGIAPILSTGDTTAGGFDRYGVRVVLIAVSPYAKKGYVGHHVYDHTSITRFIEAKFKLPALTARDANAEPLTDLFDFSTPTFATPPTLTAPTVDPTELTYCETTYGK